MLKNLVISAIATGVVVFSAVVIAADNVAVLIVSHEVADFSAWKKRFDEGKANREKAGLKERYVMRDAEKPSAVIVVLEAGSLENAKKYASDSGFRERLKKASSTGTADVKIGVMDSSTAKK